MSFWGLVSTLSDSGKAFLESTKRDIADFSSSLQEETRELHLLPSKHRKESEGHQTAAEQPPSSEAEDSSQQPRDVHTIAEKPTVGGGGGSGSSIAASASSNSASSRSSLGLGLEKLGGRVLHLIPLPNVFSSDSSTASSTVNSASSSSPLPSAASFLSSASSLEAKLLLVLRERSTFTADPVDPSTSRTHLAFPPFAAVFFPHFTQARGDYDEDCSALLRHPTVQRWHSELVDGGMVDEGTFWCRALFARQRVEEEEKRRQKLQNRLQRIQATAKSATQGSVHSSTSSSKEDELDWGDDDDEESQQMRSTAEQEQPHSLQTGMSSSFASSQASTLSLPAHSLAPSATPSIALDDSPELLTEAESRSPANSEGSGELIDKADVLDEEQQPPHPQLQLRDQADGGAARLSSLAAPCTAASEDYDEWE